MRRDQWRTSIFCNIASVSKKKLLVEWLLWMHDFGRHSLDAVTGAAEDRIARKVII